MVLTNLPDHATAFVDANIFVYHFTGVSRECQSFLERSERRLIHAATGVHILLEVLHRLMVIEAVSKGLVPASRSARQLKQHWNAIQQLNDYQRCVAEIRSLKVHVYPVTLKLIRNSAGMRTAHGLMTNDSVTAAMMFHHKITNLVTLDADLKRSLGLKLYEPTDVPS
jgi:predicted nucleic acid-binding protein